MQKVPKNIMFYNALCTKAAKTLCFTMFFSKRHQKRCKVPKKQKKLKKPKLYVKRFPSSWLEKPLYVKFCFFFLFLGFVFDTLQRF